MTQILRTYKPLLPLIPIAAVLLGIGLAVLVPMRYRRGATLRASFRRAALELALSAWVAGLLIFTIPPAASLGTRTLELRPFVELPRGIRTTVYAQMAGNAALFVPFGALVPVQWPTLDSSRRVLVAAGTLSLVIEVAQFVIGTGRQSSVTDVILNTAGAALGYGAFSLVRVVARRSGARIAS
jgi:glycopeptide antibiotics resistance protein